MNEPSHEQSQVSLEEEHAAKSHDNNFPKDQSHDADTSDIGSIDPAWTESTNLTRRRMGRIQVMAFMINQMVGTGIFSTPGTVLLLTGSKSTSLVFFAIGGVYTFLSSLMYLEYGTALPYSGGPLIWLDETFHRPAMLAATIFSWYWILFCTSGNCRTVAQYIVALVYPDLAYTELPDGWIRFLSVVVQTVACLLLYFARRITFMFNSLFAAFKIVLLLVIFAAGMAAMRGTGSGTGDWNGIQPGGGGTSTLSAMIYVIYSYQGWEHTNYIAGEIRQPKRVLKWAVFISVIVVTALYMLVTAAFYSALTYSAINDDTIPASKGIAFLFAEKVFGSGTGIKVCIALSAWSQTVAYTYTASKVKQAIAWQRIIPFYNFVGKQDRQFDSPGGALVLHWIFTVIGTIKLPVQSVGASFSANLYTYGYEIEMVFLGLGLLKLSRRMKILDPEWKHSYLRPKICLYTFATIVVGFNLMILITTAIPKKSGEVPDFYWPVTMVCLIVASLIYWACLTALQYKWGGNSTLGQKIGLEVRIHSQDDEEDLPDSLNQLMREAIADGSRRRVEYKATGQLAYVLEKMSRACSYAAKYLEA